MVNSPTSDSRRLRRGKAFLAVTAVVALLAVGGFAAYKLLFNRPGEAATALIPGDADLVVTLDTSPSQRQVAVFKKITDALQSEGIAKKLDEMLKGIFEGKPLGEEIRPHLLRSFAVGMWMADGGGEPEVLTLCAIDDPSAVKSVLEKYGQAGTSGVYAIPGSGGRMSGMVVERYLALSTSTSRLGRLGSDRQNVIAANREYVEARAALPEDANLMVFMTPKFFKSMGKAIGGQGAGAMKSTRWMAYSATIVPEGIAFDYQCPTDASQFPAIKALGAVAPFDLETLRDFPEGAYGIAGYSQVGKYWDVLQKGLDDNPSMRQEMDKGISQFEKETGLSVAQDIVPALQGEQVLAVYPGPSGKGEDVDFLVAATGSQNARPAALAEKVRALIERKSSQNGKGVRFVQSELHGVTVWEVDESSRQELVKEVGKSVSPTRPSYAPSNPGMAPPTEGAMRPDLGAASGPPEFLRQKTAVYAEVNGGILLASSRSLLERALETKATGRSLATEAAFAAMRDHLVPGSQGLLMVDVGRIMQTLKPTIDKSLKDSPIQASDLEGLFGEGLVGLVCSGKYDGNVAVGRMLLPLNFERGIAMIGDGMRAGEPSTSHTR